MKKYRLSQIFAKDGFMFSYYSGLAYADVSKFTRHHIDMGCDGERWTFINRTKTDTRSNIPLLPVAAQIIEKYKNHPQAINQERLLPTPPPTFPLPNSKPTTATVSVPACANSSIW